MRSGRCGSLSRWALGCLLAWAGCNSSPAERSPVPPDTWEDVCVDSDGDGHGFQCAAGEDCDESDPSIFEGCMACSKPNEGCECEADTAPVDCELPKSLTSSGSLLCKTGTRYCREGVWSGCEGIKSFEAPPPSRLLASAAVDSGAAQTCGECDPDCYVLDDPLIPNSDSGSSIGSNVVPGDNGGITLGSYILDGGAGEGGAADTGLLDEIDCTPGTAPDFECDGIPDLYDPFPYEKPFDTDHNTIFMDLGPGEQQTQTFEIEFFLNTADIYLYLDMTGSMSGELTNLIASLRDGNYMPTDENAKPCRDRNRNKDTSDEEYLKSEGITGNIACLIRDSSFGTGWHRDLPFPKPDASGLAYGPHDFELFQHEQDITDDVEQVLAALNRFHVRGGINRPEGGIMGLYALATGSELYVGWDRPGNPARTCDTGFWGYPCFRDDAVPIIIWMTDAPVSNGPVPTQGHIGPDRNQYGSNVNQPVNWGAAALAISKGDDGHYTSVSGNEGFDTAYALQNVHTSFKTYVGNTRLMAKDITYANVGGFCSSGTGWHPPEQGAPDAVFSLSVTENEPLTISTRGSRFQTSLAILSASSAIPTGATSAAPATTTPAAPFSLDTISLAQATHATGLAPTSTAVFTRDAVGCLANGTSSSDKIAASVVKFNLASDASTLRVLTDSTSAAATALFAGRPGTPTDTSMSSSTFSSPWGTGTRTRNSNDYFGSYNAGDLVGAYRRFTGGDTSDTDLNIPNFDASLFTSAPGNCSDVTGTSRDAVFDFSLSAPTTVRIEGTNNNSTLQAGFDHVIALVRRTTTTHGATSTSATTDGSAAVIDPAELANDPYTWTQYRGLIGGSTATYGQSEIGPYQASFTGNECTNNGPLATGYQAVYTLTPTVTGSYDFNTIGSNTTTGTAAGTSMWISVHEDAADTQRVIGSTNPNTSNTSTSSAQDLGSIDSSSAYVTGGNINTNVTSSNGEVNNNTMATGCANSTGGRDALYRFTVSSVAAGPRTITVSLANATGTTFSNAAPGFNGTMAVYYNGLALANRQVGSCTDPVAGNGATMSFNASSTGTYYVLVKALNTGAPADGSYGLWVRDTTVGRSFDTRFKGCNYGSATNASTITAAMTAGRKYYIVVRGPSTGMAFKLNARRTPTAPEPNPVLACDHDTNGTQPYHSVITRSLPAGNYSVIIRGVDSDYGSYNLIMRDVGAAPVALACNYDGGAGPGTLTATNLAARDASNNPIDYYLVVRGNSTATNFWTQIDSGSSGASGPRCAFDNVTMTYSQTTPSNYSYSTDIGNAEWTGTLPLGNYYVVVKGYNQTDSASDTEDDDSGMYQLTVGDRASHESSGTFADQRWGTTTTGVLKELKSRNIHVITVDSTTGSGDDATYSDQQLRAIALATDAVDSSGNALFYKISSNGTGLGTAIVQAVSDLAENLAMDVGVQLVEEPQSPAPKHFRFTVRAIDQVGDGCDPPPQDRDNDALHIADTHVACYPGAEPRFEISFTNPTPPNQVLPNPLDEKGGYNMKLRLIGRDGTLNADGTPKTYNIDEIPVYIIPEDVVPEPGEERFNASGTYEQILSSAKCFDNESPLWGMLGWMGTLDSGTSVTWKVCTADTEAELASCTPQTVATFSSGVDCTDSSQCENGYCPSDTHKCEFAIGTSCASSAECGVNADDTRASCVSGACVYNSRNADVRPALARGLQGKAFARVQAVLQANSAQTRAPTVSAWNLRYTCSAQE
jgi:hypothetical protein